MTTDAGWTAPTPDEVDGPLTGPERPILDAMLDWQRSVLFNICAGLDARQLCLRPLPPSPLSLLGLVRHLAKVERVWLRQRAAGEDVEPLYDLSLPVDTDFEGGDEADARPALQRLRDEQDACRAAVASVSLDHIFDAHGQPHSLRMVLIHLIEEYARHNGHADLIREQIDGVTGR